MKNRIFGVNKQKKPIKLNVSNCSIKRVNTFLKNTKTKVTRFNLVNINVHKQYLKVTSVHFNVLLLCIFCIKKMKCGVYHVLIIVC